MPKDSLIASCLLEHPPDSKQKPLEKFGKQPIMVHGIIPQRESIRPIDVSEKKGHHGNRLEFTKMTNTKDL